MSRQRVGEIIAQVESWIAAHSTHELAQKMRVRCGRRREAIWSRPIESLDRSRLEYLAS